MPKWFKIALMIVAWLISFGHSIHAHTHCTSSKEELIIASSDHNEDLLDLLFNYNLGENHLEELRKIDTQDFPLPPEISSLRLQVPEKVANYNTRIYLSETRLKCCLSYFKKTNVLRGSPNFQR